MSTEEAQQRVILDEKTIIRESGPKNSTESETGGFLGLDTTYILILFLVIVFVVLILFLLIYHFVIKKMRTNPTQGARAPKTAASENSQGNNPPIGQATNESSNPPSNQQQTIPPNTTNVGSQHVAIPASSNQQSTAPVPPVGGAGGGGGGAPPAASESKKSGSLGRKSPISIRQTNLPSETSGREKTNGGSTHLMAALAGARDLLKETEGKQK